MRYAHRVADLCEIVIEKGETSYGAYVPDLPGCFAVGESLEEVKDLIAEAILSCYEFRLHNDFAESLLTRGLSPLPVCVLDNEQLISFRRVTRRGDDYS